MLKVKQKSGLTTYQPLIVFCAFLFVILWRSPLVETYISSSDLGYQLSLGRLVFHGQHPYSDVLLFYGPLTAYSSALAIGIWDSLVSEVLICTIGYAAALAFVSAITRRAYSPWAAWLVPCVCFFLLGRFYKWYYWLFPAAMLYFMIRYIQATDKHNLWIIAASLAGAIGGLFRFDLGLMSVVFMLATISLGNLRPLNIQAMASQWLVFLVSFSVPFIFWFSKLYSLNGIDGISCVITTFILGSKDIVTAWSLPIPDFSFSAPLSVNSLLSVTFVVMPLIYICSMLYGLIYGVRRNNEDSPRAKIIFLIGMIGIGIYPQSLSRSDVAHLLQVIWPVVIAIPCLGAALFKQISYMQVRAGRSLKFSLSVLILISLSAVIGISRGAPRDLRPIDFRPIDNFKRLHLGMSAKMETPNAEMYKRLFSEAKKLTKPDQSILTLSLTPQFFYYADRRVSGMLNAYGPGVLTGEVLRQKNLERVISDPPATILVQSPQWRRRGEGSLHYIYPKLIEYLENMFSTIAYEDSGWSILVKSQWH
ncbi:MAG: hypothetical protein ABW168_13880 [Sedimenticola sp.]